MDQTKSADTSDNTLVTREAALRMLAQILDKRNSLDETLERDNAFNTFNTQDKAFTRMLLTTTLRRLGQIDDLIQFAQERPDDLKTPVLKNILRLGVTQIFFMDVPDHASVDTSVKLAEQNSAGKQKAFVNAVLRKLTRDGQARLDKQDAARLNTPEWLLKIWIDDYGLVEAGNIANAHLAQAPLDITIKSPEDRAYFGNLFQASELKTGTLRRHSGGSVKDLEGFDEGKWWVQDASAALPAMLLGEVKDQMIVDLCAAPGGKTMQLAAMGAKVVAVDRSANRLKRLRENIERIGLSERVEVIAADGASWEPVESPSAILLDAPCSATGTIRRHPDNPYLKSPQDLENLMSIQTRLLNHAAEILAIDGVLIYCTCSLQKCEGEDQIQKFLQTHPNFERVCVSLDEIGQYSEFINADGDLRILPHYLLEIGGLDGFFISRLRKIKS